ncbi:SemiSWEET transporter [Marinagarivorans algicola]|uniref:SemiSWEET transporter n=1 Tax=Marinagarivorans algicola TaxID=1513270 RepID=UPI0006B4F7CA|nr:SemiSWEET transporter [Marinagarivorans algicola]
MTIAPDTIGYLAACLTTCSFAPQAVLTLRTRDTKTLSLVMYSMFVVGVFFWLLYGIIIKDWVIIVANICTELFALPILGMKVFNLHWGNESGNAKT